MAEPRCSVEQSFSIGMVFLIDLWPLIEAMPSEWESARGHYEYFFDAACSDLEGSGPWKTAVCRVKRIPSSALKDTNLLIDELFPCVIEFCKVHNERAEYKASLGYLITLLESMQSNPEKHVKEWSIWKQTLVDVLNDKTHMSFDWDAPASKGNE